MPNLPKSKGLKWRAKVNNTPFSNKEKNKEYISKNSKFYNSKEWKSLRNYYIKAYPLCKWCEEEGKVTSADVVDHVKEIIDGGDRLNEANLMSLCHRHHIQKTNWERAKRRKRNGKE
tara:strand:- start:306 stop:656 length:351 start_codon:yes stop_codon:yes gene_type:complete